jgi:hypothetical protein
VAHVEADPPLARGPDLVADAIAVEQPLRTIGEAVRDDIARAEARELWRERPVVGAPRAEEGGRPVSAAAASPAAITVRGSVRPHVAWLTLTARPQIAAPPFFWFARTASAQAAASTSSKASQLPAGVASPRRPMLTARRTRVSERSSTSAW